MSSPAPRARPARRAPSTTRRSSPPARRALRPDRLARRDVLLDDEPQDLPCGRSGSRQCRSQRILARVQGDSELRLGEQLGRDAAAEEAARAGVSATVSAPPRPAARPSRSTRARPSASIAPPSPASASGSSSRRPSSTARAAASGVERLDLARRPLGRPRARRGSARAAACCASASRRPSRRRRSRGRGSRGRASSRGCAVRGGRARRRPLRAGRSSPSRTSGSPRRSALDDALEVALHRLRLALELCSVRVGEARARLRLELVAGQVLRLERERLGEVALEVGGALAGDAVDEIERDVVKSGITRV